MLNYENSLTSSKIKKKQFQHIQWKHFVTFTLKIFFFSSADGQWYAGKINA